MLVTKRKQFLCVNVACVVVPSFGDTNLFIMIPYWANGNLQVNTNRAIPTVLSSEYAYIPRQNWRNRHEGVRSAQSLPWSWYDSRRPWYLSSHWFHTGEPCHSLQVSRGHYYEHYFWQRETITMQWWHQWSWFNWIFISFSLLRRFIQIGKTFIYLNSLNASLSTIKLVSVFKVYFNALKFFK